MRRNDTPGRIVTNVCTDVGVHDVITCADLYDYRLRGLGVAGGGGKILGFSIDLRCRPYNTVALPCECVIVFKCTTTYIASTVLTATGEVNGKWQILTTYNTETPKTIATKFGRTDNVNEWNPDEPALVAVVSHCAAVRMACLASRPQEV